MAKKKPQTISEVGSLTQPGSTIYNRSELKKVVEKPLLPACEELYDKNIRTTQSSANQKDIGLYGRAFIEIDYQGLSSENKKIADDLVAKGLGGFRDKETIDVYIPVNQETTVDEVKRKSLELAHRFKKQPVTWGMLTLKEITDSTPLLESDRTDPEKVAKMTGLVYDKDENIFYQSKELHKKAKEYDAKK
ncbi:MAG: hypothetical protein PHC66_00490 [Candidatus Nanoarchaeia archaeon]|nr:hypothetical protein [Candidatus Nanoarchaeia archaeon]MDD5239575.1 hypothetical protein [Candidatus Nanoarchaeia archaeon]